MKFPAIVTAVALLANFTAGAQPPTARLAIVSDDQDQDLAALLTTELSSNSAVTMVERNDLAKIGDEAKVRQMADSNASALGKLLGADGLVFLDRRLDKIEVRLTAVNLGYALFDEPISGAINPVLAAKQLAHVIAEESPKLRLSSTMAIPISLLNLRADVVTPASGTIERSLTLLLESRLASVPEYVVLERRHGASVSWERSFENTPKTLLQGAYVIDGSLDFSQSKPGQDDLSVRLRVRPPGGDALLAQLTGSTNDLPNMVEQITRAIEKTTHSTPATIAWQPAKEAREYLEEAIWAWQHQADAPALEALDSAELLGETAPDLTAVRVSLLDRRAWNGLGESDNEIGPLPAGPPTLDQRTDDALEAIRLSALYRAQKMESHLQLLDRRGTLPVRSGEMIEETARLSSKLLAYLDRAGSPRAGDLRQALRTLTAYDPLHGKMGAGYRAAPWLLRDVYADDWASSLDEELAFYRLETTRPNQFIPPWLIADQGASFCHRFLQNPEAEKKAFGDFERSIESDPGGRLVASLMIACSSDAVADSAYDAYLDELWKRRETLFDGKTVRVEWTISRPVPEETRRRHGAHALPLLHYFLSHVTDLVQQPYALDVLWHPDGWSAQDAATVWSEYQIFKQRVTDNWTSHDRNQEALDAALFPLEDSFHKKFPVVAQPAPPSADPLVVHRFWDPGATTGKSANRLTLPDVSVCDGGLAVLGAAYAEAPFMAIYVVQLPGFETRAIPIPETNNVRSLQVTPDAYFVEFYRKDNPRQILGRFDRTRETWEEHVIKTPFSDTGFYAVGGKIYLSMPEGGLARYDWQLDSITLLTSSRRKPAQNQFDDRPEGQTGAVFAGPKGKPCARIGDGIYYIQEQPGNWQPVFDCDGWSSVKRQEDSSLVWSQAGEVVLLDPAQAGPRYLMSPAEPHFRKSPQLGQKGMATMAPWAAQAPWDAPLEHRLKTNGSCESTIGLHGENFYVLVSPVNQGQPYELLVYTPSQREPRNIPLQFKMDAATRSRMAPVYDSGNGTASGWTLDKIEHPGQPFFSLKLNASAQGLCLVSYVGGFWFIPYGDIAAHLAPPKK